MNTQNYSNHRRLIPLFHFFLFSLILITLIGSFVNLFKSFGDPNRIYSAALLVSVSVALIFSFFFMRIFALKAQDRAIRAEENLRHFVLTGKLLDTRLSIRQIIALRFASDEEFVELAKKVAESNRCAGDIKKEIKNWKGDYYKA